MSVQVAAINLGSAVVGTSGTIQFGQALPPPTITQQMQHANASGSNLFVWNESGCGLTCVWPSTGETFTLPAGQWRLLYIPANETQLAWTVIYLLPNAPVSLLLADLYRAGEPLDPMGILGNSPVGIGGTVNTSVSTIYYNVKDAAYGAKGDGVTDDTAAITSAITAAQNAGGGVIFFPAGVYLVSSALIITTGITLLGEGEPAGNTNAPRLAPSIIKGATGMLDDVIRTPLPPTPGNAGFIQYGCAVRDLAVDCSLMTGTTAGKGNGIHFYGVRYGNIEHVDVFSSKNWGIILEGDATNFAYNTTVYDCNIGLCKAGVLLRSSEQCTLNRVIVQGADTATTALQPYSGTQATTSYLYWCDVGWTFLTNSSCGTSGTYTNECIHCTNGEATIIVGCLFDQPHGKAVQSNGGRLIFANNTIQNPNTTTIGPSIQLGGSGQNVVSGNVWTGAAGNMTYDVQEAGTPADSVIMGNAFLVGSAGTVSLAVGSTAHVAANSGTDDVIRGALSVIGNGTINAGNQILQIRSAGGGAAGVTLWVGTTDPAGSASEGDVWVPQ